MYPEDLREQFGEEMAAVFEEQVADAYDERGVRGVAAVWAHAVGEFLTVGLTKQIADRIVPILAVGTALALMLWFGGYIGYVMETACGSCAR